MLIQSSDSFGCIVNLVMNILFSLFEFPDYPASTVTTSDGSGEFDPRAALTTLGVSVPGEPQERTQQLAPVDGSEGAMATIWEWGNSTARLVVDGLQHRVRVSVVEGEWARSKVEIINNNPLDDDQKARIKPVKGQGGSTDAVSSEASSSEPTSP